MNNTTPADIFQDILQRNTPAAVAWIRGNEDNPRLGGSVKFFKTLISMQCRIILRHSRQVILAPG